MTRRRTTLPLAVQTCIVHRSATASVSSPTSPPRRRRGPEAGLHRRRRRRRPRTHTQPSAAAGARRYAMSAKTWRDSLEYVVPFLAFPADVRRVIHTTNTIEALHRQIRKPIKTRGHIATRRGRPQTDLPGAHQRAESWRYTYHRSSARARIQIPLRRPTALTHRRPDNTLLPGAALDSAELLDVDVDELARPCVPVAHGLLEPEPSEPAQTTPGQDPHTVALSAQVGCPLPAGGRAGTAGSVGGVRLPSASAISTAVRRKRRSFTIASTRSSAVRLATRLGAGLANSEPRCREASSGLLLGAESAWQPSGSIRPGCAQELHLAARAESLRERGERLRTQYSVWA
jgi:hypothetical protein